MQIFLRIIKTAWHGFWRNGWLSLVAIFIMMQVLLLVGIFTSVNIGVMNAIQSINDRIDVAVFFKDYVPETDIVAFQQKIGSLTGVKSIDFVSRQQAMTNYVAGNRNSQTLLDVIGNDSSFFPASLQIRVENPSLLETVVGRVKAQDQSNIIESTSLEKNQELINKLRQFNKLLAWGNLVISLILLIIALLIIFNTIRITIFTRREEIEIMKLVGATDWYIRWPFVLEGALYGVVGAMLAFLLTLAVYQGAGLLLGHNYLSFQAASGTINVFSFRYAAQLFIFQLLFGVLVGSISSYLATKRYLRI